MGKASGLGAVITAASARSSEAKLLLCCNVVVVVGIVLGTHKRVESAWRLRCGVKGLDLKWGMLRRGVALLGDMETREVRAGAATLV